MADIGHGFTFWCFKHLGPDSQTLAHIYAAVAYLLYDTPTQCRKAGTEFTKHFLPNLRWVSQAYVEVGVSHANEA